jgi:cytosine/adenosine deaminase-related metal-dependent hydrolase
VTAPSAAVEYEREEGRYSVGTDSNVRISVNEELRTLEYSQRLRDQKRNRLGGGHASTGSRIFETARKGGAQALGLGEAGLSVGQSADIVVLDDAIQPWSAETAMPCSTPGYSARATSCTTFSPEASMSW